MNQEIIELLSFVANCCNGMCDRSKRAKAVIEQLKESKNG